MTKPLTYTQIKQHLQRYGGRIFAITFIKRSTGETRHMLCRLHVKKGVKGTQPLRSERDRSHGLITVYEMGPQNFGFKCIPIDGILTISDPPEIKKKQKGPPLPDFRQKQEEQWAYINERNKEYEYRKTSAANHIPMVK